MATETKTYVIPGAIYWLMVTPKQWKEDEEAKYQFSFYPDNVSDVKGTGIRNKPNFDDDGKVFFRISRPESQGPFPVYTEAGEPITVLVGNGSKAQVKLEVETFTSQKHGKVTRSKVLGIVVTDLIEYVRPQKTEQAEKVEDLPT